MRGSLHRYGRGERGSAIIIALALVMALTVLVAAMQLQAVSGLKATKTQRDYERALQMAEAGVNAYLNMLANGQPDSSVANYQIVPPPYTLPGILSLQQFKTQAKSGTIPAANLVHYPAGQTATGYFVGQTTPTGLNTIVVGYGWSNGVVRRVRVTADVFSIFDWTAIWGTDPNPGEFAWKFTGSANVVGAAGADGLLQISPGANVQIYDGPLVWANGSYTGAYNNPDLPILPSGPNVPAGHYLPGGLANPLYRHFNRAMGFPTADIAANQASGTTQGVEYFRTHNDNNTGLRLLVQNSATGALRELAGNYQIVPTNGSTAWQLVWPGSQFYKANGMDDKTEVPAGIRAYPGDYFFQAVTMSPSDVLYLRTFNDADRGDASVVRTPMIEGDPANPNPGQADNRNVRFYIGHKQGGGNDPATTFTYQTYMEYPQWASRFRIYDASRGGVTVKGANQNPPPPFRVNLLNYNKDANGYYGNIQFQSATYLLGSLIGWQVVVTGGTTIEHQQPEVTPDDKLAYQVTDWRELQ